MALSLWSLGVRLCTPRQEDADTALVLLTSESCGRFEALVNQSFDEGLSGQTARQMSILFKDCPKTPGFPRSCI